MYEEPPVKFRHNVEPLLSTPNADVEEYSKLRDRPYTIQNTKNLPYYFLEPQHVNPRICLSDMDKYLALNLSCQHSEKLRRLYISLKEECGFKRYLMAEKTICSQQEEVVRLYECEISASNLRILHIKADIIQFQHSLTKIYNANKDRFTSVMEVGFAAALSSSKVINCFGVAIDAITTNTNVYFFLWLFVFEMLVVRVQTFVHLTIANYANGTGYNAWSFCPYMKGMSVTLILVEVISVLLEFWDAPMSIIRAWYMRRGDFEVMDCKQPDELGSEIKIEEHHCFKSPNPFTRQMVCTVLPGEINERSSAVFPSNYYYHLVLELTNMSLTNATIKNYLLYGLTLIMWFAMNQRVKGGFENLVRTMHRGAVVATVYVAAIFALAACQLHPEVAKEATYAFFLAESSILSPVVLLKSFGHSVKHIMPFYLEFGSKMPQDWSPDAVFTWKAGSHLWLHFFGMWLSYMALYNEKAFYESKDIFCFCSKPYLLNSAIPRMLNSLGLGGYLTVVFYLIQAYIHFTYTAALISIAWRNMSHNVKSLNKYPQTQYVFHAFSLVVVFAIMFNIKNHTSFSLYMNKLNYLKIAVLSLLVICLDLAIILYYGPARIWVDLEFLTRKRRPSTIEDNFIVSFAVFLFFSIFSVPEMIKDFMAVSTAEKLGLLLMTILPTAFSTILMVMGDDQSTEVRQFHFWGQRSMSQQYERLRFNPCQFRTYLLRAYESLRSDSSDSYYMEQRLKSLTKITLLLKQM